MSQLTGTEVRYQEHRSQGDSGMRPCMAVRASNTRSLARLLEGAVRGLMAWAVAADCNSLLLGMSNSPFLLVMLFLASGAFVCHACTRRYLDAPGSFLCLSAQAPCSIQRPPPSCTRHLLTWAGHLSTGSLCFGCGYGNLVHIIHINGSYF